MGIYPHILMMPPFLQLYYRGPYPHLYVKPQKRGYVKDFIDIFAQIRYNHCWRNLTEADEYIKMMEQL